MGTQVQRDIHDDYYDRQTIHRQEVDDLLYRWTLPIIAWGLLFGVLADKLGIIEYLRVYFQGWL